MTTMIGTINLQSVRCCQGAFQGRTRSTDRTDICHRPFMSTLDLQKEFAEDLRKPRYFGARPAHPTQSRSILEVEEAIDSIDL